MHTPKKKKIDTEIRDGKSFFQTITIYNFIPCQTKRFNEIERHNLLGIR